MGDGDEHGAGVRKAMLKYAGKYLKDIAPIDGTGRKNKTPEKTLTQLPCLRWMRSVGWSVDIYEAAAVWDSKRDSYSSNYMKTGTVDCLGCDKFGQFVAIEFKAPGRISTLSGGQKSFLIEKINCGGFGCVTDSVERLESIYNSWLRLKQRDRLQDAKQFLIDNLVPRRKHNGK